VRYRKAEWIVLTCDYNGWNDAPEDEREWFDQHPEIWSGPAHDGDRRPLRVTPKRRLWRYVGGAVREVWRRGV
jgi:hypothetical protein